MVRCPLPNSPLCEFCGSNARHGVYTLATADTGRIILARVDGGLRDRRPGNNPGPYWGCSDPGCGGTVFELMPRAPFDRLTLRQAQGEESLKRRLMLSLSKHAPVEARIGKPGWVGDISYCVRMKPWSI
jgi:hypothetical protein